MDLLQKFIVNYKNKNLFEAKDKLLIAVSGGIDSVVLCKLCHLAQLDFGITHCNFQLRGEDSTRDEIFVKEFAIKLNVPFFTIQFDTKKYAAEKKISIQEAARELRYTWFEKIRKENNYDYILTAHHADDNIETAMMSFFRGTGIRGLGGIRMKNGSIRRPLLFARRKEIEEFLEENNLAFVQDESNLKDDYTRNYFRNTILPMIAKVYPEAEDNILANIERMKGATMLYQQALAQHQKKLIEKRGNELYMPVFLLQQLKPQKTVIYEIVQQYGFRPAQLTDILQLLESDSGKFIASDTHRILKNRKHLVIAALQEISNTTTIIDEPGKYSFAHGIITISDIEIAQQHFNSNNHIAFIDAKKIEYPLILRPWKMGDYFYPLGMQKKKKLSRFLIDKKLSMFEKEKVWVIEMNKKIIWVVGHRIDDRFKITSSSKAALQLRLEAVRDH